MRRLRGPLLTACALGWGVSMLNSSTLVARLVIDGAISFLFVPVFQLVAFWVVYRRAARPLPFDDAVDVFFTTNLPWLLWLLALGVWSVAQSPRDAALWSWNEVLAALGGMLVAGVVSWSLERDLLRAHESLLYRAMAWPAVLTYFLGISLWPELIWRLRV